MQLTVYKDDQVISELNLKSFDVHPKEGVVEFFIGRSDECHIELEDKKISRVHAVIKLSSKGWSVENLSENVGTYVNGKSVTKERELKNGDIINLGPFSINTFLTDESSEELKKELGLPIKEVIVGGETKSTISSESEVLDENAENETKEEESETFGGLSIPEEGEAPNEEEITEEMNENSADANGDMFGNVINSETGDSGDGNSFTPPVETTDGEVSVIPDEESQTKIISTFVNYKLKIFGEFAPYDSFLLSDNEVYIGREAPKCQIILKDPEVSTVHAVIKRENFRITLEDLNSTNGTVLNGQRINKSDLVHGDEFVIGSTTFKFETVSDIIKAEEERLMPVELEQEMEVEEIVEEEVDFGELGEDSKPGLALPGGASAPKSNSLFSKDAFKDPAKRKKILYAVIGLLLLWVLLGEDEQPAGTKEENKEGTKKEKVVATTENAQTENKKPERILTKEEEQYVEVAYNLAKELFAQGRYEEAQREIDKVLSVSGIKFKEAEQLKHAIAQGYKRIKDEEEKRQRELEEKQKKLEIDKLLELARDAVEKKKVELAEGLFSKILILDPEQSDVGLLKMEIEAYKREEERKKMEEERIKAERAAKVEKLQPGKNSYLQKKWFLAIDQLKKFMQVENMDEDLTKEATTMLAESEKNLNDEISPTLGEARSLKEGQDLKGAYEAYKSVLKSWPNHPEALKEVSGIKEELDYRASKLYRDAIISESLSLFKDAEEKFQEVLQVAPIDSDYYLKSKEKLRHIVR